MESFMPRVHMKTLTILLFLVFGLGGISYATNAAKAACMPYACCCTATKSAHPMANLQNLRANQDQCGSMSGCCRISPHPSSMGNAFLISRTKINHPNTPGPLSFTDKKSYQNLGVKVGSLNSDGGHSWPFIPLHLQKMSIIC